MNKYWWLYMVIMVAGVCLLMYGIYTIGYRTGKEYFEKEYIPKFKEHSILIDSLSKRVDRVKEKQSKLNQCN